DPPGERVAPHLLDLRLVIGELRILVCERAHVRPRPYRFAGEAARVRAEAAAAVSRLGRGPPVSADLLRQRATVPDERRSHSSSQSARIAIEISRMSRRAAPPAWGGPSTSSRCTSCGPAGPDRA